MRKILSLTLVALMLLSTLLLSGCDASTITEIINSLNTVISITPSNSTTSTTTPTTTTEPEEKVRTTITKREFLDNIYSNNYTASGKKYGQDGVVTIQQTPDSLKMTFGEMEVFYTCIDGTAYEIVNTKDGCVVEEIEEYPEWMLGFTMICIIYSDGAESVYDSLVYDENTSAYTWKYGESGCYADFYFEEGKLVKYVLTEYAEYGVCEHENLTFSDIGTTVVEIPEFSIEDNEKITLEEWCANMNALNYTLGLSISVSDEENTLTMTSEVIMSENGYIHTATHDYGEAGVYSQTTLRAFVDGGVYKLKEVDGVYFGTLTSESTNQTIGYNFGLESEDQIVSGFDLLIYDNETDSYVWEINGQKCSFYFEDGVLVKVDIPDEDYGVMSYTFSNIGTSVVTLPEFTIIATEE